MKTSSASCIRIGLRKKAFFDFTNDKNRRAVVANNVEHPRISGIL